MTGSQGEPRSALARAANGDHDLLKLGPGDLVLHSARIIPGNDAEVYEMWNRLVGRGAKLVAERAIHTSGHAQRDELEELLRLVRPRLFVPVHGETTFLHAHAALAREVGLHNHILANGQRLDMPARSSAAKAPGERATDVELVTYFNDGPATGDEEAMRLKERKRLAWNGVVVVDARVSRNGDGSAVAHDVELSARALFLGAEDALLDEMRAVARRTVAACPPATPWSEISEAVRASVRAAARRATDKRPEVVVLLHQGRMA
jgi:mRNA degradation ribonuclease J1/J2